jgi:hypothetical protein
MQGFITSTLTQLASQLPTMLVCLVGLVLALMFFKRIRRPSICTFIGAGLLLLTTIVTTFVQNYLIFFRDEMSLGQGQLSPILMVLAILSNILRAVALALILSAVFMGRPKSAGKAAPIETKA